MKKHLTFIFLLICSPAFATTYSVTCAKTGDNVVTKNAQRDVSFWNEYYKTDDCVKTVVQEPTQAELEAIEANAKKQAELDELDRKSIRSLRAVLAAQAEGKTPDASDINTLKSLETQAKAVRDRH